MTFFSSSDINLATLCTKDVFPQRRGDIITVFISPLKFFFKNSVSFLRFVKFSFSAIRPYKKGVSIFICFDAKIGIKYEINKYEIN